MKLIKYDDMLSKLNDAVKLKGPDYVYPRNTNSDYVDGGDCLYVYEGQPDCIAAHAYVGFGVSLGHLAEYEAMSIDVVPLKVGDEVIEVTEKAEILIRRAQRLQDDGMSWGEAVVAAAEYVHENHVKDFIESKDEN